MLDTETDGFATFVNRNIHYVSDADTHDEARKVLDLIGAFIQ